MRESHAVYSSQAKIVYSLLWLVLLFVAVVTIFPVCYVVFGSFKENKELLVGGANIFPKIWIFDNYVQAWEQANFATYTANSLFLSVGVMTLSLFVSSMAGYVFSRRIFGGKEIIYMTFVAFIFINVGSVALRPMFELAVKLNMNKSLVSVVIIAAGGGQATFIFLCRGFVNSVPRELDEAAKIDGCSFFRIWPVGRYLCYSGSASQPFYAPLLPGMPLRPRKGGGALALPAKGDGLYRAVMLRAARTV